MDFAGAIATVDGDPHDGAAVEVVSHGGEWLARGTWSGASQIQVRLWTWNHDEAIDSDLLRRRVAGAVAGRASLATGDSTTAYRLVFVNLDGLPGVIADRYGDYIVVQLLTVGAPVPAQATSRRRFKSAGRADLGARGRRGASKRRARAGQQAAAAHDAGRAARDSRTRPALCIDSQRATRTARTSTSAKSLRLPGAVWRRCAFVLQPYRRFEAHQPRGAPDRASKARPMRWPPPSTTPPETGEYTVRARRGQRVRRGATRLRAKERSFDLIVPTARVCAAAQPDRARLARLQRHQSVSDAAAAPWRNAGDLQLLGAGQRRSLSKDRVGRFGRRQARCADSEAPKPAARPSGAADVSRGGVL